MIKGATKRGSMFTSTERKGGKGGRIAHKDDYIEDLNEYLR